MQWMSALLNVRAICCQKIHSLPVIPGGYINNWSVICFHVEMPTSILFHYFVSFCSRLQGHLIYFGRINGAWLTSLFPLFILSVSFPKREKICHVFFLQTTNVFQLSLSPPLAAKPCFQSATSHEVSDSACLVFGLPNLTCPPIFTFFNMRIISNKSSNSFLIWAALFNHFFNELSTPGG